ncbi:unnamed protein product [Menidia menidia]|uniref:(Atlantic silverside) hypothetical protein n=1 Tax=Menidia menidia TaxID=238744 RepID=A0A8S4BQV2_9TELE|nr:unnamed protein product [Menidia menidia]
MSVTEDTLIHGSKLNEKCKKTPIRKVLTEVGSQLVTGSVEAPREHGKAVGPVQSESDIIKQEQSQREEREARKVFFTEDRRRAEWRKKVCVITRAERNFFAVQSASSQQASSDRTEVMLHGNADFASYVSGTGECAWQMLTGSRCVKLGVICKGVNGVAEEMEGNARRESSAALPGCTQRTQLEGGRVESMNITLIAITLYNSPFQRVRLLSTMSTGDPDRESTLQAESLSSSSKDESSSSSSSPIASWHDSNPGSDTAVKSDSDWTAVSKGGGGRLDWQLSEAENPGQLKLWKDRTEMYPEEGRRVAAQTQGGEKILIERAEELHAGLRLATGQTAPPPAFLSSSPPQLWGGVWRAGFRRLFPLELCQADLLMGERERPEEDVTAGVVVMMMMMSRAPSEGTQEREGKLKLELRCMVGKWLPAPLTLPPLWHLRFSTVVHTRDPWGFQDERKPLNSSDKDSERHWRLLGGAVGAGPVPVVVYCAVEDITWVPMVPPLPRLRSLIRLVMAAALPGSLAQCRLPGSGIVSHRLSSVDSV